MTTEGWARYYKTRVAGQDCYIQGLLRMLFDLHLIKVSTFKTAYLFCYDKRKD